MSSSFTNPIITGFNPDPTIVRVRSDFFLVTSSFEYFPGLPVYHSKNLLDWKLIGHALTKSSQLDMRTVEPGAGIWAPTLRYRSDDGKLGKGRWYLACCTWFRYRPSMNERIFPRGFFVYNDDDIWNTNGWSDPIHFDNPGFDQDLFWDDDGKVYLSTTLQNPDRPKDSKTKDMCIYISEVDINTGKSLTDPKLIRSSNVGLKVAEGSHIVKKDDYYYLFTAEGGTEGGHSEFVSRSTEGPMGPWELGPNNPVIYNSTKEEIQNVGHLDIFDDEQGQWWAVHLGVRPIYIDGQFQESVLGRESFLIKVDWIDGWPKFNNGEAIRTETDGRGSVSDKVRRIPYPPTDWEADLTMTELELGWYTKHTPIRKFYSTASRPGWLRIHGNCYNLSSPESPALLLRKQTTLKQAFHAALEFSPSRKGYEAGIVVFWSSYSYASIGIRLNSTSNKRVIIAKTPDEETVGSLYEREVELVSDESTRLLVGWKASGFILGLVEGDKVTEYGFTAAKLLTRQPPLGMGFSGICFGLYSFGNWEPCLDPADFTEIKMVDFSMGKP